MLDWTLQNFKRKIYGEHSLIQNTAIYIWTWSPEVMEIKQK